MRVWIERISSWALMGLGGWAVLAFSGHAPESPWIPLTLLLLWIAGDPIAILIGVWLGLSGE